MYGSTSNLRYYDTSSSGGYHSPAITYTNLGNGDDAFFEILASTKKLKGDDKVLEKLLDLVFVLNLSDADVKEIKAILEHSDWKDRVLLYVLVKAVREGMDEAKFGYNVKSE